MTIKHKYSRLGVVGVFALVFLLSAILPTVVSADAPIIAPGCSAQTLSGCTTAANCQAAGGVFGYNGSTLMCSAQNPSTPPATSTDSNQVIPGTCSDPSYAADPKSGCKDPAASGGNCQSINECDLIEKYLNPAIQLLSAMVGVVIAISIVIGGIQYVSSAGNPQAVAAARDRIRNAIIALVVFMFLYALLNFLIPGGLFHG